MAALRAELGSLGRAYALAVAVAQHLREQLVVRASTLRSSGRDRARRVARIAAVGWFPRPGLLGESRCVSGSLSAADLRSQWVLRPQP